MSKFGCCVDKACTKETCMNHQGDRTCLSCGFFYYCKSFLSLTGEETNCDWFPNRYAGKRADG